MAHRSAGVIVFRNTSKGRKFLVIRSSRKDSSKPEYWDVPKGLLKKNEKGIDAALRETREESGIVNFKLFPGFKETIKYFIHYKGKRELKFVAMFLMEVEDDKVVLSWEHDKYEWFSYNEALVRLTNSEMKKVLRSADKFVADLKS